MSIISLQSAALWIPVCQTWGHKFSRATTPQFYQVPSAKAIYARSKLERCTFVGLFLSISGNLSEPLKTTVAFEVAGYGFWVPQSKLLVSSGVQTFNLKSLPSRKFISNVNSPGILFNQLNYPVHCKRYFSPSALVLSFAVV